MSTKNPPLLDAAALLALARQADRTQAEMAQAERAQAEMTEATMTVAEGPGTGHTPCPACAELVCPGWESLGSSFDTARLEQVGTLVHTRPDDAGGHTDDATLSEYHPRGSHAWSADAPVAPAWYPYNRCSVWRCRRCARAFLRYTEYGGYYVDERIRAVDPATIELDAPPPG